MGVGNQDAIKQLQCLMENVDEQFKITFKNMHMGYPTETLARFLKARDGNVAKAHKMLIDCLHWRVENEIDKVLAKPIPADLYKGVRDSQLIGMSGYTKEGLPVVAVGVGLSTYDKASDKYYIQSHIQVNEYRDRVILPTATKKHGRYIGTCVKVLDMTGLKFSALNQLRLLTAISTIDDLNYPEKTDTYYIVNAPYVFSACWKVVKPLLQERTRKKIQVLQGCGKDELLKQANFAESRSPMRQGSFYVDIPEPDPEDAKIAKTIEVEFHKLEHQSNGTIEVEFHKLEIQNNGFTNSRNGVTVNGH
ncbi:hypothetical protein TSUD_128140 [Trifolium subterraneum]|nr:hypothetical protein TSUD_128140 [Trifolium subterraneum]